LRNFSCFWTLQFGCCGQLGELALPWLVNPLPWLLGEKKKIDSLEQHVAEDYYENPAQGPGLFGFGGLGVLLGIHWLVIKGLRR
jgi:hypothetical protein